MLMSAFIVTLITFYTLVAVFMLFMTRQEQRQTQNTSLIWNTLSCVACVFWPVSVVVTALLVALQRAAASGQATPQQIPALAVHAASK